MDSFLNTNSGKNQYFQKKNHSLITIIRDAIWGWDNLDILTLGCGTFHNCITQTRGETATQQ